MWIKFTADSTLTREECAAIVRLADRVHVQLEGNGWNFRAHGNPWQVARFYLGLRRLNLDTH